MMKAARLSVEVPGDISDDSMERKREQATPELQAPKSPVPRSSLRITRRSAAISPAPATPAEIIPPAPVMARWQDDDDVIPSVPRSPTRAVSRPALVPGAPKKPQTGWKRRASEADLDLDQADELPQDASLMSRALDFRVGDVAAWTDVAWDLDDLFPWPGCAEVGGDALRPVHHREHYSHSLAAPAGAHRVLRFATRC